MLRGIPRISSWPFGKKVKFYVSLSIQCPGAKVISSIWGFILVNFELYYIVCMHWKAICNCQLFVLMVISLQVVKSFPEIIQNLESESYCLKVILSHCVILSLTFARYTVSMFFITAELICRQLKNFLYN